MTWNKWIRQIHRWISIAFTLTVIVSIVNLTMPAPLEWLFYVPLAPLGLLLLSGLNLYVQPYVMRIRR
jgi:hypothetical protein